MRLALLDWILVAVSLIKISKSEESTSGSVVFASSDRQDQKKDFNCDQTTESTDIQFSKVGTDSQEIRKPNQNIKAGQERIHMETYPGLLIGKEMATKPSNEINLQAGFKLLDWKRRRKRFLERWNHLKKSEMPGGDEKSTKNFNILNNKESNFNNHINLVKKENRFPPSVTQTENKDKMAQVFGKTDSTELQRDPETAVHIYTQPRLHNIDSNHEVRHLLHDMPELRNVSSYIDRNIVETIRRVKRTNDGDYEDEGVDTNQDDDANERKSKESKNKKIKNRNSIIIQVNPSNATTTGSELKEVTAVTFAATITTRKPKIWATTSKSLTTQKRIFNIFKNESIPLQKKSILNTGKDVMSVEKPKSSKKELVDYKVKKNSSVNSKGAQIGFAECVTPPVLITTGASSEATTEEQVGECHPKGTGPLTPNNYDADAPKMEEVEDALTGKLADRVVEVVMAKVSKEPKMMRELGLSCQGNLTKIQASISHPESKQGCNEKSGEGLKQSVLQEISAAVERLTSAQSSSGACLKPPDDLTDFLAWLLSDDTEADMPEPAYPRNQIRPQDGEYLFRTNMLTNDENSDPKEISKCNWDDWMIYSENMSEDDNFEKSYLDSFEDKHHSKNRQRITRNTSKRKKKRQKDNHPKSDDRRKKYTPWSLSDYP